MADGYDWLALIDKAEAGDIDACMECALSLVPDGLPGEGPTDDTPPEVLKKTEEYADVFFEKALRALELKNYFSAEEKFDLGLIYLKSPKFRDYKKAAECFKYVYNNYGEPEAKPLWDAAKRLSYGKTATDRRTAREKNRRGERIALAFAFAFFAAGIYTSFLAVVGLWRTIARGGGTFWAIMGGVLYGWGAPLGIFGIIIETVGFFMLLSGIRNLRRHTDNVSSVLRVIAWIAFIASGILLVQIAIITIVAVVIIAAVIIIAILTYNFFVNGKIGFGGIFGSSSSQSTFSGVAYDTGAPQSKSIGSGTLVQDGMHRYIQFSNGKRIPIEDYDTATGTAKGYDGNTYVVKGGGITYKD